MRLLNGGENKFGIHFRECYFMQHFSPIYRSPNIYKKIVALLNGKKSITIDNSLLDKAFGVS
jgi:hypothetical protein